MDPVFFPTPGEFRSWLVENHDSADALLVGYWRKSTGRASVTWKETVDEALCFGWIDGIRHRIDDASYSIRFTPRRRGSVWSDRNVGRVEALIAEGRMQPSGLAAWEARDGQPRGDDPFETSRGEFPAEMRQQFGPAWAFHEAQPPGYRRLIVHWVFSAKRQETVHRRLRAVIAAAENGSRVEMQRPYAFLDE